MVNLVEYLTTHKFAMETSKANVKILRFEIGCESLILRHITHCAEHTKPYIKLRNAFVQEGHSLRRSI